jgi:hypothetical protein
VITHDSRLNKGCHRAREPEQKSEGERGSRPCCHPPRVQLTAHTPLTVVVVAYPLLRHLHLAFPLFLIFPTVRHNLDLPDSPGHVAVRSTRREAQREEPKQSKPKGTRSVTCWYPPLPFALYSTLHTLRPKPILAHIPHRLLCFHPLEHRPHPAPIYNYNLQGQTSKGE